MISENIGSPFNPGGMKTRVSFYIIDCIATTISKGVA